MESFLSYPLGEAGRAYLASRGLLEVATAQRFGEVSTPLPGHEKLVGRLVIPYLGPRGNVYGVTLRCMGEHDCKADGHPKYDGPSVERRLYNLRDILSDSDTINITEGELDAATLIACGLPAVACPGANSWKPYHRRLFTGFHRVVVWPDGDSAGRDFGNRIRSALPRADVMMVMSGEDVNSTYLKYGKQRILEMLEGKDDELQDRSI